MQKVDLYTGPFVDGHIHLWNTRETPRVVTPLVRALGWAPNALAWLVPKVFPESALRFVGSPKYTLGNYLEADWHSDTEQRDVTGFVHIEASWKSKRAFDETAWLESICGDRLLAVVGHADLASPGLRETLDAHSQRSAKFVGVRNKLAFSADPSVMSWCTTADRMDSPAWRNGYAELGRQRLTFDAWCYGHQLAQFNRLLRAEPQTRVVLDHLGTPVGAGGRYLGVVDSEVDRMRVFKRWQDDLSALAEHKQLFAKISGLTMPVVGFDFHTRAQPPSVDELVDKLGPFVTHALDVFTVERCFFASNFPMDKVSVPWTTLFAAYEQLTRSYGVDAQAKLFAANAKSFYSSSG